MDETRFNAIMAGARGCRIVVVGDVMLDRYVEGRVDRISPEAPVPVVHVAREWGAVGGAGNVAANVRALGAACDLIGVAADDEAGRRIRSSLADMGVRHHFVADGERPTTAKTRVLAKSQQIVRVDRERSGPVGSEAVRALADHLDRRIPGADVVILEDYNKGVLTPEVIRHTLVKAAELGIPTVVDPKWENFFAYDGATVFKPNRKELTGAMAEPVRPDDVDWLESARSRLGCTYLLLTLGSDGMVLLSPGPRLDHARAVALSVYDVSGAGDTVSAAFSVSLAAGGTHAEAMTIATHAAATAVAKAGVATVTPGQIWHSMTENSL